MRDFYEQFKTPIVFVILIFLGLGIYTKIFGPIPFYINSTNTTKTDLFSSSGTGEATAVPDQATIYVGVTKTANTVETAQKQVNTIASKLISDLKKLGIKDKDIKTTNYSVNPNYNNVRPMGMAQEISEPIDSGLPYQEKASGYEVTQNIEVKIKPIELTNKVIDVATTDGANLVGGVNFTFSDDLQKKLEQESTKKAVDDAKGKAKALADTSGIRLGKIVNVVSSTNNYPYPMTMEARKADDTTTVPPTEVTPGEGTVTISVTIYYETY